jgi:hypothetical protein
MSFQFNVKLDWFILPPSKNRHHMSKIEISKNWRHFRWSSRFGNEYDASYYYSRACAPSLQPYAVHAQGKWNGHRACVVVNWKSARLWCFLVIVPKAKMMPIFGWREYVVSWFFISKSDHTMYAGLKYYFNSTSRTMLRLVLYVIFIGMR